MNNSASYTFYFKLHPHSHIVYVNFIKKICESNTRIKGYFLEVNENKMCNQKKIRCNRQN